MSNDYCDLCKNDGYVIEVTYKGESVGLLETGAKILGWDTWLRKRYATLKVENPLLPDYGRLDPYNREHLKVYSEAIHSDIGRETEKIEERAVFCECTVGNRLMDDWKQQSENLKI